MCSMGPLPLLAAVLAHEFAHNVLKHRAWHEANGGRKRASVRLTEREADRLSPWLLANAGLDPRGGVEFFKGEGCERCGTTGYRGRTAIHEIMVMDAELRRPLEVYCSELVAKTSGFGDVP